MKLLSILLLSAWIAASVIPCGAESAPVAKTDATKPGDKTVVKAHQKSPTEILFAPSFFEENPRNKSSFGKDVFFPRSQRLKAETQDNPNGKPVQDTASLVMKHLTLKGVSGASARRLALLNNRTMAVGEVWDFKLNGQVHRIKCEEIRPHSVVLTIEGVAERQELPLKSTL